MPLQIYVSFVVYIILYSKLTTASYHPPIAPPVLLYARTHRGTHEQCINNKHIIIIHSPKFENLLFKFIFVHRLRTHIISVGAMYILYNIIIHIYTYTHTPHTHTHIYIYIIYLHRRSGFTLYAPSPCI